MFVKSSAQSMVTMPFMGMDSGYRVAHSTNVKIHLCFHPDIGSGPSKHIATRSNGSPKMDIPTNCVFLHLLFDTVR